MKVIIKIPGSDSTKNTKGVVTLWLIEQVWYWHEFPVVINTLIQKIINNIGNITEIIIESTITRDNLYLNLELNIPDIEIAKLKNDITAIKIIGRYQIYIR